MFYRDSMNNKRLIEFMRRLSKDAGRKVFLILDKLKHMRKLQNNRYKVKKFFEHPCISYTA
jgi:hypothetical protein